MTTDERAIRSETRYIAADDGLVLPVAVAGSGPPLVYVRGWVSHLELMWESPNFRAYFEPFAREMTLVRYDTRGNGLADSPHGPLAFDDLVHDLEAVVSQLALERVTLYGDSFGGPIAIAFAARHPDLVNNLVLDGTYADLGEAAPPQMREFLDSMTTMIRVSPHAAYEVLEKMTDPAYHEDPRSAELGRKMLLSMDPLAAAGLYQIGFTVDVRDSLSRIEARTLVMHRKQNRSFPIEYGRRLAARIPGAQLVELEGSAANSWTGGAQQAFDAVAEFLGLDARYVPPAEQNTSSGAGAVRTILFTDLVDSTVMQSRLGDDLARSTMRHHDTALRDAIAMFNGREIKHTGDGMMVSFGSAADGVSCALRVRDEIATLNDQHPDQALLVRFGLNAGEPISENDDLFGLSVTLAARIGNWGPPMQVLVSDVVRQLLFGKGFSFASLGEANLKGISEPVRLFAVERRPDTETMPLA